MLPITFGQDIVNEGDFGQLVCTVVRGDEPLAFTWHLHGDIVSSEPGLTTSQLGSRTSILMIQSVGHRHSGKYTCNVSNQAGSASSSTDLKVNGTIKLLQPNTERPRERQKEREFGTGALRNLDLFEHLVAFFQNPRKLVDSGLPKKS